MKSENVQFSFPYYAAHFSNKIQQWNKLNSSLKCKKAQRTKRKMDKEKKRIKIVQYSIIKVERKENQPFLFRSSTQYWWQFHFYLWVFEFPVSGGKISISRFFFVIHFLLSPAHSSLIFIKNWSNFHFHSNFLTFIAAQILFSFQLPTTISLFVAFFVTTDESHSRNRWRVKFKDSANFHS